MSADETNCIDEETDGPDGKENANAGKRKSVRLDDAPSVGRDAKSNHLRSFVLDKKKKICSSTHFYPLVPIHSPTAFEHTATASTRHGVQSPPRCSAWPTRPLALLGTCATASES
jgi:hypothetical protein